MAALEADEEIGNLEEEKVAVIEGIAEVLEKRKTSYQLFTPKKKLFKETASLIKFCVNLKHSITKTNESFYAGVVVLTNRLGVKINKVVERKEPI